MKHVFVETNFLIAVAQPNSDPSALRLLDRSGRDTTLHLPWCSRAEASRTLDRVIDQDLGFEKLMLQRALRERDKDPALHAMVQRFARQVREDRRIAKASIEASLDEVVKKVQIIPPSEKVVDRTLLLSRTKSLKPFDEMVLGAVLAKAEALFGDGERELYFCNLNKNDFSPFDRVGTTVAEPALAEAYQKCGLEYRPHFDL